jgi:hypothetical protein
MKALKMAVDDLEEAILHFPTTTTDEFDELVFSVAKDHSVDPEDLRTAYRTFHVGA